MRNRRIKVFLLAYVWLPVTAGVQTDMPSIAFGNGRAVALRNNGDVLTWGAHVGCQLGRGGLLK